MTDHLPECLPMIDGVCICARLRACEARIKTHEGCADAERAEGYEEGRKDAAQAVAALSPNIWRSNEDGWGGYINGKPVGRAETFTYYVQQDAAVAAAARGRSNETLSELEVTPDAPSGGNDE